MSCSRPNCFGGSVSLHAEECSVLSLITLHSSGDCNRLIGSEAGHSAFEMQHFIREQMTPGDLRLPGRRLFYPLLGRGNFIGKFGWGQGPKIFHFESVNAFTAGLLSAMNLMSLRKVSIERERSLTGISFAIARAGGPCMEISISSSTIRTGAIY